MTRTNIINALIKKNNYKSYLEIGVQRGTNFEAIVCENKIGVDPDPKSKATHFLSSDKFFDLISEPQLQRKFDIIFIDGLHENAQVYRDIVNSLRILNEGGTILCYDMHPTTEAMQAVPRQQTEWTGDCWLAWIALRSTRKDLRMRVVNTDYGIGIIKKGVQELLKIKGQPTYKDFEKNKVQWLPLISITEFKMLYL